ncbi:hypothetical protein ZIOFF_035834 [Zingiber officinale]|uniref:Uncharacterized protein n=1 Tax=Zingiber officinale TaxID=94328 RepID=A0A8J5GF69_ZINOF|nr:hypothetical protein ZIOFF_035834 [Zingiber officinale]
MTTPHCSSIVTEKIKRSAVRRQSPSSYFRIMDSQNSSLGTKRKLFIAPGSLARGRGKITRHLGLSGQNHVSGSIEHEPSLVNTCNNDMQYASKQVDHVEDSQAQMESSQDKSSTQQNLNKRGSKPFRQLAYEMGGKDGPPPDFASMFFETRKKGDHIVDLDAMEKYDEISEVVREDSSCQIFNLLRNVLDLNDMIMFLAMEEE